MGFRAYFVSEMSEPSVQGMRSLDTLVEGGRLTAGSSSQISDGAAALMICNDAGLKKLGVEPLARVTALGLAATDPVLMLQGPIPATERVLERAGLKINDIDLFEVNEAFACVPIAWLKGTGADPSRLNVNGGACALGHPLGEFSPPYLWCLELSNSPGQARRVQSS